MEGDWHVAFRGNCPEDVPFRLVDGRGRAGDVELGAAEAEICGPGQLLGGDLGVVAGEAGEADESFGIGRAELGGPLVVDVVNGCQDLGVAYGVSACRKAAGHPENAVNHLAAYAVDVLVAKPELGGGGVI